MDLPQAVLPAFLSGAYNSDEVAILRERVRLVLLLSLAPRLSP